MTYCFNIEKKQCCICNNHLQVTYCVQVGAVFYKILLAYRDDKTFAAEASPQLRGKTLFPSASVNCSTL